MKEYLLTVAKKISIATAFCSAFLVGLACNWIGTFSAYADDGNAISSGIIYKETPEDFNRFLEGCSQEERILLMQSMRALPKIPKEAFGNLSATIETPDGIQTLELKSYDEYEDESRPKTFNELFPKLVLRAVEKGFLSNTWSPKDIKEKLYWHAHHWSKYLVRDKNNVDYHEIVKWCAKKEEVVGENTLTDEQIAQMSTTELSGVVAERYFTKVFDDLWRSLKEEDKKKTLENLEKQTGKNFTEFQKETLINWDKASLADKERVCKEFNERSNNSYGQVVLSASMGAGAVLLGGLGIAVSTMGFAFYTAAAQAIAVFSLSTNAAIMSSIAFLSGPWGWCIAGTLAVSAPFIVGWANPVACANFIVARHAIEASRISEETQGESFSIFFILIAIVLIALCAYFWRKKDLVFKNQSLT